MEKPAKVANNVSGVVVFYQNFLVLLGKRAKVCYLTGQAIPYGGYWSIFAGSLEKNENSRDCAQRELFEETKINVKPSALNFYNTIKTENLNFYIYSLHIKEIPKITINQEHSSYGWFGLNSLPDKIDPKISEVIKNI